MGRAWVEVLAARCGSAEANGIIRNPSQVESWYRWVLKLSWWPARWGRAPTLRGFRDRVLKELACCNVVTDELRRNGLKVGGVESLSDRTGETLALFK